MSTNVVLSAILIFLCFTVSFYYSAKVVITSTFPLGRWHGKTWLFSMPTCLRGSAEWFLMGPTRWWPQNGSKQHTAAILRYNFGANIIQRFLIAQFISYFLINSCTGFKSLSLLHSSSWSQSSRELAWLWPERLWRRLQISRLGFKLSLGVAPS